MLFYGISLIMKEKSNASALHLGRATTASGTCDERTTSQIRRQVVFPDFHVIGSEVW